MENLTKAIFAKKTGSSFNTLIGGRMFEDYSPEGVIYPYVVYSVVSSPKEKTFTEIYRNTTIQFSIYSSNSSSKEIKDIYAALSALYDECSLIITGSNLVWMREENIVTAAEDVTTPNGLETVRVYHVDFEIRTSLN